MEITGSGYYIGTTIDNKWWKRYRGLNFFARGNGIFVLDMDKKELRFTRYLTTRPILFEFDNIEYFTLNPDHAGKKFFGRKAVIFHWHDQGKLLSSGILFSAKDHQQITSVLQEYIKMQ